MKIEYMRLENWRSFYGENEIVFSTDQKRNVTIIRAENGVGKTSLLAALNWCLFGILDEDDFEKPDKLVNDFAIVKIKPTQQKLKLNFLITKKLTKLREAMIRKQNGREK